MVGNMTDSLLRVGTAIRASAREREREREREKEREGESKRAHKRAHTRARRAAAKSTPADHSRLHDTESERRATDTSTPDEHTRLRDTEKNTNTYETGDLGKAAEGGTHDLGVVAMFLVVVVDGTHRLDTRVESGGIEPLLGLVPVEDAAHERRDQPDVGL